MPARTPTSHDQCGPWIHRSPKAPSPAGPAVSQEIRAVLEMVERNNAATLGGQIRSSLTARQDPSGRMSGGAVTPWFMLPGLTERRFQIGTCTQGAFCPPSGPVTLPSAFHTMSSLNFPLLYPSPALWYGEWAAITYDSTAGIVHPRTTLLIGRPLWANCS